MKKAEPVQQTAPPARFGRAVVRQEKTVNSGLSARIVNVRPKKAGQVGRREKNF